MIDQVMKLVEAGFTKDEIMKMIPQESNEPENNPEENSEPENKPEPEKNPLSSGMEELLKEMNSTLKSMQAANIQNSRMPEESREKPEDILASLIYPSFNQKEKSK